MAHPTEVSHAPETHTYIHCIRCKHGLFAVPHTREVRDTEALTIHGRTQQHLRECQETTHA